MGSTDMRGCSSGDPRQVRIRAGSVCYNPGLGFAKSSRGRVGGAGGAKESAFATSTLRTGMQTCALSVLGPSRIWRLPHHQPSADRIQACDLPVWDPLC